MPRVLFASHNLIPKAPSEICTIILTIYKRGNHGLDTKRLTQSHTVINEELEYERSSSLLQSPPP